MGLCDAGQERGGQMLSVAIKASSFLFPRQALPCTLPAAAHPVPRVPRLGRELSQRVQPGTAQLVSSVQMSQKPVS